LGLRVGAGAGRGRFRVGVSVRAALGGAVLFREAVFVKAIEVGVAVEQELADVRDGDGVFAVDAPEGEFAGGDWLCETFGRYDQDPLGLVL
jgi:hypothetical protein